MRRPPALAALALILLALAWRGWVAPFLAQDDCLDDGGAWVDGTCEGARSGG